MKRQKTIGRMCGGLADKRLLVTPPKPNAEAKPADAKDAKYKPTKKYPKKPPNGGFFFLGIGIEGPLATTHIIRIAVKTTAVVNVDNFTLVVPFRAKRSDMRPPMFAT
jgi:hypothetical protein